MAKAATDANQRPGSQIRKARDATNSSRMSFSETYSLMNFLNLEQLPFVGMSYQFHGEKQGAPFSAYFVNAKPGQGPPLHTHPYVEVELTLEGNATVTVGDDTREVNAGSIVVIPANTPPRFVNS